MRCLAKTLRIPAGTIHANSAFQKPGIDSLDGVPFPFALQCKVNVNMAHDAGIRPESSGSIHAHLNGTPADDPTQTRAIHAWFGRHFSAWGDSSTRSMAGQALGAAGAIEPALPTCWRCAARTRMERPR